MKRSIMVIGIAALALSLGGCHKKKDTAAAPAAEASSAAPSADAYSAAK